MPTIFPFQFGMGFVEHSNAIPCMNPFDFIYSSNTAIVWRYLEHSSTIRYHFCESFCENHLRCVCGVSCFYFCCCWYSFQCQVQIYFSSFSCWKLFHERLQNIRVKKHLEYKPIHLTLINLYIRWDDGKKNTHTHKQHTDHFIYSR